jgi:hypothetical protein
MISQREDILKRIRANYNVPAYYGVTVIVFDGQVGTIVGATPSEHLKIEIAGHKKPGLFHPTWEIIYVPYGQPPLSFRECDKPEVKA